MSAQPPMGMQLKLVTLAANAYYLLDGAPVKRQQAAHNALNSFLAMMTKRWPDVDLSSDNFIASLQRAAKIEADKKVIRGAGSSF